MASKKVSGIFGGKGTPAVGSWDAMHSFSTRASDKFGGKVHAAAGYTGGQVSKALQEFYKTEKLNPCITAIKITVDPKAWTTAWEVTIEESPDGKAYVGFNSWGGASGGYPKKLPPSAHAYSNYKKEIQNVLAKNPKADLRNVLDFYIPGGFRQIFFQYTIPDKFPALPKSPNAKKGTVGVKIGPAGSPADLPDYNGVLVPTVTLEEEPPTIAASASNPDQAKTDAADAAAQQQTVQQGPLDPRNISGKFVLKVKSGPGVIIGDTEVDITEGVANFTGIQFDQPGDYVISVSSAAPDIDSTATEIKIKVLPPPEAIPQEPKGASASETSGTRPIIAQIDPASEELVKQIAYDRQGSSNTDAQSVASTIGRTVLVNYNGTQINDRDVQSMTLYHDGIVPKIDITFRDTNGMIAKEPPRDDTKFEIFINSKSDNLKDIHLKFKIEDHMKIPNGAYQFKGTLDVSELYRMKFKVYRGTSFQVLRQICKDMGLGFNSNIDDTKDEMPWRNIGDKQFRFMEDIVKHSYISDDSFMAGYIDYYYCFNYVDVEKEMTRDIANDAGIDTGGFDSPELDVDKMKPLVLTSDPGMQTSNMHFIKTGERNESTKTSMEQGYKTRTKFYDKVKKMFLVFDVDSTTSDGSKSHILKGAGGDKEAFDNNYVTKYEGKIDTDNAHKNYNYAVTQNRINLDNMVKVQMDIKLPNPNLNIYKYMKINANVIKDGATPTQPERVQWRWSGDWLISDIKYEFIGGRLNQNVTLVRKEMGKDPAEMREDNTAAKPEAKEEKNENPIAGSQSSAVAKPNDAFKPGEEYTVQDQAGYKYIVKINSLLENGNEVKAEIRDIDYVYPTPVSNPDSIAGVTQSGASQSGASQSGTASTPPPAEGSYWPEIYFRPRSSRNGQYEEYAQEFVTYYTENHIQWILSESRYMLPYENMRKSNEIWIAIKRPIPDFKPEKEEKNWTPKSWLLYELNDTGIDSFGDAVLGSSYDNPKWEIVKSRITSEYEAYYDTAWKKPKGYIKVLDSTGKAVYDSEADGINAKTTGPELVLGIDQTAAGMTPSYNLNDSWFTRNGTGYPVQVDPNPIPKDQLYTSVGGLNTIFIDMSNPSKYPPGTYTLEVKYNVPKLPKDGGKRLLEPKDANGYSPYVEKIFKETFTISRRSQRR